VGAYLQKANVFSVLFSKEFPLWLKKNMLFNLKVSEKE
jgi:hypothetical protein